MVTFKVEGRPAPQGSKRHVGNGRLIESSKHLPEWRTRVVEAAYDIAIATDQIDGPISLNVRFYLKPPKLLQRTHPTTVPDLDKLIRAICDALQIGGLIQNDSQIVMIHAMKTYSPDWQGAEITIETID